MEAMKEPDVVFAVDGVSDDVGVVEFFDLTTCTRCCAGEEYVC
jgi:hypothetical protein